MTDQVRFELCLGLVLQEEGGFFDDPRDPTSTANLGVSIGALSQWLGRDASIEDVEALTPWDVLPIYKARYWQAAGCDRLPVGLDLLVFDTAVDMGVDAAVEILQEVTGVRADGEPGERTLRAARAAKPAAVLEFYTVAREARYRDRPEFPDLGQAGLERLSRMTAQAEHDIDPRMAA
jgi:lysozyme family protein